MINKGISARTVLAKLWKVKAQFSGDKQLRQTQDALTLATSQSEDSDAEKVRGFIQNWPSFISLWTCAVIPIRRLSPCWLSLKINHSVILSMSSWKWVQLGYSKETTHRTGAATPGKYRLTPQEDMLPMALSVTHLPSPGWGNRK